MRRPLGGPNTPPEGMTGGFWKTRVNGILPYQLVLAGFLNHQQYQPRRVFRFPLEVVSVQPTIFPSKIMAIQPIPPNVPPPRNKGLIRPYLGKPMVNKPLIRPYFWGGYVRGFRGVLVDQPSKWVVLKFGDDDDDLK